MNKPALSQGCKLKDILQFHQIVMAGLVEKSDLGKFRTDVSAII